MRITREELGDKSERYVSIIGTVLAFHPFEVTLAYNRKLVITVFDTAGFQNYD